jgi:hypothetical protein
MSNTTPVSQGADWFYKIPNLQLQNQLFNLSLTKARLNVEIRELGLQLKATTEPQAMAITEQRMKKLQTLMTNMTIQEEVLKDQMTVNSSLNASITQMSNNIQSISAPGQ